MSTTRAIRIPMFFLIFLSVALAQQEIGENWKITNLDLNGNPLDTYQWLGDTQTFLVDVENLNTFYGRDFELHALSDDWEDVLLIEELKETLRIVDSYSSVCTPYTVPEGNHSKTYQNCTILNDPYMAWFNDYKPAKMHMINGKSETQKTETIHIGKGETKRFRVTVKVPFGESGKFSIGVYDVNDLTMTLLDPWYSGNWSTCKTVTATEGNSMARENEFLSVNFTSIAYPNSLRLFNGTCTSPLGSALPFQILGNGSDYMNIGWIANATASEAKTFAAYYDNPAASLQSPLASHRIFADNFDLASLDSCWEQAGTVWDTANGYLSASVTSTNVVSYNCTAEYDGAGLMGNYTVVYDAYMNDTQHAGTLLRAATKAAAGSYSGYNNYLYLAPTAEPGQIIRAFQWTGPTLLGFNDTIAHEHSTWYRNIVTLREKSLNSTIFKRNETTGIGYTLRNTTLSLGAGYFGFTTQNAAVRESLYDNFSLYNNTVNMYIDPLAVTVGSAETSGITLLTINAPTTGTTHLNNTILLNFTPVSAFNDPVNFSVDINGVTNVTGFAANNTAYTLYINFTTKGEKTIRVTANETSKNVTITIIFDNVTNTTFTTPTYETASTTLNISIESLYTISDVQLIWNSTQYAATAINSTSWTRTLTPPIVQENNTNVTFYWNYTVGAPTPYQNISANYTQTIIIAHNISDTLISSTTILEGDLVTFTLNFTNHFGSNISATASAALVWNGTSYAMSYISRAGSEDMYQVTIPIPQITASGNNATISYSHIVTFTYITSRTENVSNTTTVHKLTVSNTTGNMSIVIKAYLENTRTQLFNVTFEVGVDTWNGNITHNYTLKAVNVDNITLYISPGWATFLSNISVIYSTDTTTQRTITLFSENLTGQLREISLFLLNVSDSLYSELVVMDRNSIPVSNILLSVHRFNYEYGSYDLLAQGLTDSDGKITTYLIPYYVDYFFTLRYSDSTLIKQEVRKVRAPLGYSYVREIFTLYQATSPMHTVWTFLIDRECEYNNVTLILTCTVTDTSATHLTDTRLVVDLNHINRTRICDSRANGTSATHTCNLSAMTQYGATYYLYGTSQNIESILTWGSIAPTTTARYGEFGVLIAVGLILVGALFGVYYNPIIAMLFSLVGLIAANSMGYLDMSATGIAAVVVIFATIAIKAKA